MSAPARLRIVGGAIHDPANGVDGEVRDICIEDGRIVADLPGRRADARRARDGRDAWRRGHPLPLRQLQLQPRPPALPEEHAADPRRRRRSTTSSARPLGHRRDVPSTFTTGYRYAGLGYTTVFDAAVAPLTARHSHSELDDTPCVDGGFFVLMGNDEYLLRQIAAGERGARARLRRLAAGRHRRLRHQDRESRRHRGVEDGPAERHRPRRPGERP